MRELPEGINLNAENIEEAFNNVEEDIRMELRAITSALILSPLIAPLLEKLTGADVGTPVKCAAYLYQHISQDDIVRVLITDILTKMIR